MKKPSLLTATAILTVIIVFLPPSNKAWLYKWEAMIDPAIKRALSNQVEDQADTDHQEKDQERHTSTSTEPNSIQVSSAKPSQQSMPRGLPTLSKQGVTYLKLEDVEQRLPIQTKIDAKGGEITIIQGEGTFTLLRDVPVINNNGIFAPLDAAPLIKDQEVWLPVSMLQKVFKQKITVEDNRVHWRVDPFAVPAFAEKKKLPAYSVDQMAEYLSFLQTPIPGAHVSTRESHLPGAPRPYRNGVHEGIDWYGGETTGMKITDKTPVYSMADGIVVRADHDYKEMSPSERQRLLALGVKNNGQTPAYILDKLRGRSVWVQYDRGVMARYVHLSSISENVKVGQRIKAGEIVGLVGNSGTSYGAEGNNMGLHLHLDIFVYGDWFWENYSMQERREILEKVFNQTE